MVQVDKLRYFLDGPGEALIATTDFDPTNPDLSKILCVVTAKSAAFRGSATMEPVTGGRSLAPRRKFLTEREITFELSDCEMDFRYVSLSQGEDIVTGSVTVWAFGESEQYVVDDSLKITLNHTPVPGTLIVQEKDTGELVEATLAKDTATLTGVNKGDEVLAIYQYEAADVKQVSTLNDSIPRTVKIIHNQPMFDEDNNIIGTQQIELFKAAISGEFEEAYEERAAFAPSLTFEVLDPKRADKKLVDHRIIPVPEPEQVEGS
jgi:hypothetical protein